MSALVVLIAKTKAASGSIRQEQAEAGRSREQEAVADRCRRQGAGPKALAITQTVININININIPNNIRMNIAPSHPSAIAVLARMHLCACTAV